MLNKHNNRFFKSLDYGLLLILAVILIVSLAVLSTASINVIPSDPYHYVKKQVIMIISGLIIAAFVAAIDYEHWRKLSWWIYGFNILLLSLVFVIGSTAKGAQRWIPVFGDFNIQPSEFAKILLIVTFAHFLANRKDNLNNVRDFIPPLLFVLPPTLLVFLQPDLGTALVFAAIFIGMMFVAGANPWKFGAIVVGSLAIAIGAVFFHFAKDLPWPLSYLEGLPLPLEDYQLARLLVFIDPAADQSGAGYHVIQSVWAIGSGGLWGTGYREGTQAQLNFLPEHHTDFIFSVIGEEFGFIGTSIVLFLFCIFLLRMISIAMKSRDDFGLLIVAGFVSMLTFHILVNVGMASGIMPVTGIPLPFITAGGSSMWANMMGVGLVLSVAMRRERPMF